MYYRVKKAPILKPLEREGDNVRRYVYRRKEVTGVYMGAWDVVWWSPERDGQ